MGDTEGSEDSFNAFFEKAESTEFNPDGTLSKKDPNETDIIKPGEYEELSQRDPESAPDSDTGVIRGIEAALASDHEKIRAAAQELQGLQQAVSADAGEKKFPQGPPWHLVFIGDEGISLRLMYSSERGSVDPRIREDGVYLENLPIGVGIGRDALKNSLKRLGDTVREHKDLYHAVVFCTDNTEAVRTFCRRGYNIQQHFRTPIIIAGEPSAEDVINIGYPNIRWVNPKGQSDDALRDNLCRVVADGIEYVKTLKPADLLVMVAEPGPYEALRDKGIDVYAVPPTDDGFWEARQLLKGNKANEEIIEKAKNIGAVVVDGFNAHQPLLLHTVKHDSELTRISRICVGGAQVPADAKDYNIVPAQDYAAAVRKLPKLLEEFNFAKPLEMSDGSPEVDLDSAPEFRVGPEGGTRRVGRRGGDMMEFED